MTLTWASLLIVMFSASYGQKSPYASMGTGLGLLPRFRPEASDSELSNRDNTEMAPTSTALPDSLKGTLEDDEFIRRVALWPEDRQPFWFKNRQVLYDRRHEQINGDGGETGQRANIPWFFNPQASGRPSRDAEPQNFRRDRERPRWKDQQRNEYDWRNLKGVNSGMRWNPYTPE